jgi:hypothetical protein
MERSLKNDLTYGLNKEIDILPILINNWSDETNIRNTKDIYNDEYCSYDFESDNKTSWEVKSRRNTKLKYPTTIFPVHKIRDVDTSQYFVFNFTDGGSYIKYDKELFKTFNKRMIGVKRIGASSKPVQHYEIPVDILIDLKK